MRHSQAKITRKSANIALTSHDIFKAITYNNSEQRKKVKTFRGQQSVAIRAQQSCREQNQFKSLLDVHVEESSRR